MTKNERGHIVPGAVVQLLACALCNPTDDKLMALLQGAVTEREWYVLKLRFGIDGGGERSLKQVAQQIDVTRERVRQIQAEALKAIRHSLFKMAKDNRSAEARIEKYVPSVMKLQASFRKACQSLTWSEHKALAYTLQVDVEEIAGWRAGVGYPPITTMAMVAHWVRRGKPTEKVQRHGLPKREPSLDLKVFAPPYQGATCDVCGERVLQQGKGLHIMTSHPEYRMSRVERRIGLAHYGSYSSHPTYAVYQCGFCSFQNSSPAYMVRHITEEHQGEIADSRVRQDGGE